MLKVGFWIVGLPKLTKCELVLVCFNTPFNTMKLLLAVLSTVIGLSPVAAFAGGVAPLNFARGSYCGYVTSGSENNPTWYTIKAKKNQVVEILTTVDDYGYNQLRIVNITKNTVVKLRTSLVDTTNGGQATMQYFLTGSNSTYRIEWNDTEDLPTSVEYTVCIK